MQLMNRQMITIASRYL